MKREILYIRWEGYEENKDFQEIYCVRQNKTMKQYEYIHLHKK